MKVSELVKDIVRSAEDKFGVSGHMNDSVGVDMFVGCADGLEDIWFVSLTRPSQNELDRGEVEDVSTSKLCEMRSAFHSQAPTLVRALTDLQEKVDHAYECDWE